MATENQWIAKIVGKTPHLKPFKSTLNPRRDIPVFDKRTLKLERQEQAREASKKADISLRHVDLFCSSILDVKYFSMAIECNVQIVRYLNRKYEISPDLSGAMSFFRFMGNCLFHERPLSISEGFPDVYSRQIYQTNFKRLEEQGIMTEHENPKRTGRRYNETLWKATDKGNLLYAEYVTLLRHELEGLMLKAMIDKQKAAGIKAPVLLPDPKQGKQ